MERTAWDAAGGRRGRGRAGGMMPGYDSQSFRESSMKYRILGKTNLRVSVIGMGTWQFGGEWGIDFAQEQVTPMFRRALELGINLIDTAECYGDHLSEKFIGEAIRDLGADAREKFILATKCGHRFVAPFNRTEPRSGPDIQKQLDDSLHALQTDYIDLYQYHSWGDEQFESQEVRAALEKAQAAGKIRHIGNSLGAGVKTSRQVDQSDAYHVEAIQVVYNRLQRSAEEIFFPGAQQRNLGVLARVPLASGLLSGKYKPGAKFPENDVRTKWQAAGMDERLAEVQKIAAEEVPRGVAMAHWALAW
ncbi:MAG TPA: aldo/keto reductase, partial [Phycisphaerae bacterium]|nr:aldo/keto reductase [Phycisphaerae bacterium]